MSDNEKNLMEMKNDDTLVKMKKWVRYVEISCICMSILFFLFFYVALFADKNFNLNNNTINHILVSILIILKFTSIANTGTYYISKRDEHFQYLDQSLQEKFKTYTVFSTIMLIFSVLILSMFK